MYTHLFAFTDWCLPLSLYSVCVSILGLCVESRGERGRSGHCRAALGFKGTRLAQQVTAQSGTEQIGSEIDM